MDDPNRMTVLERVIARLTTILPDRALSRNRLVTGMTPIAQPGPAPRPVWSQYLDTTPNDIVTGPRIGPGFLPATSNDDFVSHSQATAHLPTPSPLRVGF